MCIRDSPTGATGDAGPTGATGPAGTVPDNVFASFFNYGPRLTPGSLISLYPSVTDPTGQITAADPTQLVLAPGYYLISYSAVSYTHLMRSRTRHSPRI